MKNNDNVDLNIFRDQKSLEETLQMFLDKKEKKEKIEKEIDDLERLIKEKVKL
jgi:hypothetical protein